MRKNLFKLLNLPYEKNILKFGACLCHRCPNGRTSGEHYCVNPEHIYLGTFSENNRDTYRDNPGLGKFITDKNRDKALAAALSQKSRTKRKETFKKIGHSKGVKNSQFGTKWITDGTKEGSRKVKVGDPLPEGFREGRVCK